MPWVVFHKVAMLALLKYDLRHSLSFSGKADPEQLLVQRKKGKPTMVFFNVRKEYCSSEKHLVKITSNWASLLLDGNVQVQNYPVSYSCLNDYISVCFIPVTVVSTGLLI